MKVALISTKATNIGDDLIRRGVQRMLTAALPGTQMEWRVINKHQPWTVYVTNESARTAIDRLPRGKRRVTDAIGRTSRVLNIATAFTGADLVVQCGTPVMWPGVANVEWQGPIWEDALDRIGRPPVMNLSGGSCYPWTAPRPVTLDPADQVALSNMLGRSDLFTARDPLAAQIARSLGKQAEVFSCAAIHSGGSEPAAGEDGALLLNVMPRGGHFDWGQNLDPDAWLRSVDEVVAARADRDTLLFLCHSQDEFDLARRRWPDHEAVLPVTTEEYLQAARRGRIALVNRMHAAVTLAGLGIPAIAVGTDTRLLMVAQTGQPVRYLGEVEGGELVSALAELDADRENLREALLDNERSSFEAHRDHIQVSDVLIRAAGLTMV